MEIIIHLHEKIKQLEEVRKLGGLFKENDKYQQEVVEFRKLKNIVQKHDKKLKVIDSNDNNQREADSLNGNSRSAITYL